MMIVLKGTLDVTMLFNGNVVTLTPRREAMRAPLQRSVVKPSMEIGR
jgi:hypothetical protein